MTSVSWRAMAAADLAAVSNIAAAVHPDFPEEDAVFAERLALCPDGCHVLVHEGDIAGYVISHPWTAGSCPPLNALLGSLPADADSFYIHDLALLPLARGSGAAVSIVDVLKDVARSAGYPRMCLVAVNNSAGFWRRQGFESADAAAMAAKLASYGADARYMTCSLG